MVIIINQHYSSVLYTRLMFYDHMHKCRLPITIRDIQTQKCLVCSLFIFCLFIYTLSGHQITTTYTYNNLFNMYLHNSYSTDVCSAAPSLLVLVHTRSTVPLLPLYSYYILSLFMVALSLLFDPVDLPSPRLVYM